MGIIPKCGNHPRGWASAPRTPTPGERGGEWHPQFTNSSHTYPTHLPIGGLGGNCMPGVCKSQESPYTTPLSPTLSPKDDHAPPAHSFSLTSLSFSHIFRLDSAYGITNTPIRNSNHIFPTHHQIGGLGGKCMVGNCKSHLSPNTS